MTRPTNRLLAVAAALLAALALTGCVKLDEDLTINADNTVDGEITVAFNKAMLDTVGASPEDPLGETGGVPDGAHVTVEPYEDDTFVGQTYTLEGASLDELNAGDADLQIVRDGDNFHVTGTLDFSDSTLSGDGSVPTDGFEVRIALTFPGEIVSSTGEIDGTTVTWTPEMGDVVDFETVAKAEGGGTGAVRFTLVGIGLAVAGAAGATILLFQQRKRTPIPDSPAGIAPPVHPGAASWPAPAPDPRHDLDAAPPAAVPFDPTED